MDLEQLATKYGQASVQEVVELIGYDSVEQFWDYVAEIDSEGRLWGWSSGQEDDVCMVCNGDLSEVADILLLDEGNRFRVAHQGCVEARL